MWCRIVPSAILLALFGGAPALAHVGKQAKALRLKASDARLLIRLSWDANPGDDAKVIRSSYDRNGDGRLDEAESAALQKALARNATGGLVLSIDGKEQKPSLEAQDFFGLDLPVGSAEPLGVHLMFAIALPAKDRTIEIRLEDRSVPPRADLDIPAVVELDAAHVAFANMGELYTNAAQIQSVRINRDRPFVLRLRRP